MSSTVVQLRRGWEYLSRSSFCGDQDWLPQPAIPMYNDASVWGARGAQRFEDQADVKEKDNEV
jgi:hypothetical protein